MDKRDKNEPFTEDDRVAVTQALDGRKRISALMVDLDRAMEGMDECIFAEESRDPVLRDTSLLCVGGCFALWRAAFLTISEKKRPAAEMKRSARLVLKELLAHNRFAYDQEQRTIVWFGGYYLDDAVLRLDLAMTQTRVADDAASKLIESAKRGDSFELDAAWDTCCAAFEATVRWLSSRRHSSPP